MRFSTKIQLLPRFRRMPVPFSMEVGMIRLVDRRRKN
jgi:hypothetical protein